LCEPLHDRARFSDRQRKLYVAEHLRIAQREADDVGRCDGANTFWRDRDSESGANQPQNCEPVRGFLHDVWPKAMLLEYRKWLLEGAGARGPREVNERFVA